MQVHGSSITLCVPRVKRTRPSQTSNLSSCIALLTSCGDLARSRLTRVVASLSGCAPCAKRVRPGPVPPWAPGSRAPGGPREVRRGAGRAESAPGESPRLASAGRELDPTGAEHERDAGRQTKRPETVQPEQRPRQNSVTMWSSQGAVGRQGHSVSSCLLPKESALCRTSQGGLKQGVVYATSDCLPCLRGQVRVLTIIEAVVCPRAEMSKDKDPPRRSNCEASRHRAGVRRAHCAAPVRTPPTLMTTWLASAKHMAFRISMPLRSLRRLMPSWYSTRRGRRRSTL